MFTLAAYTQHFDPVGNSLFASTIFAALPLIALFVLLGGLKWKAQWPRWHRSSSRSWSR